MMDEKYHKIKETNRKLVNIVYPCHTLQYAK